MKAKIENCEGFEWDDGNSNKNWHLHAVTCGKCEDAFFNLPLIIAADKEHSENEQRFFALGEPMPPAVCLLLSLSETN